MNQRRTKDAKAPALTIGEAFRKAIDLLNANRPDEAFAVGESILAIRPQQADVHRLLGTIAYKKRDSAKAIQYFQRALKLDPKDHESRLNLALTYRDFAMWADAASAFENVLKHFPDDATYLYDLGKVYSALDRHSDAIACYRKALPTTPSRDVVETALASAFLKQGDLAMAETHYTAVLARTPGFIPALVNLAVLRDAQGQMDQVMPLLDAALAHEPNNVDAHYHRALANITRERFSMGWPEYVWRYKRPGATTLHDAFAAPYWNGEPLQDKHLLVWTEQGLGDEILLAGLIPDVLARGARCTLVCTERLAALFQHSFPTVRILTRKDIKKDASPAIGVDFQASLSQLGEHLRPSTSAFPHHGPYLTVDTDEVNEFRQRYRSTPSERIVGIAWHSANPQAGAEKSTSLLAWEEILRTPGVRFVSLQYGDHEAAHGALAQKTGLSVVVDPSVDAKNDLMRFGAQVAAMDLVISVSNTTVHFAGALNVPVWTLVPASAGRIWYWFLDRTDSPWYPSMRLFRQSRDAGWAPTLHTVAEELKRWP